MRTLFGIIVLVIGICLLGWWGANTHAERMQAQITDDASAIVAGTLHPIDVSVNGRDIHVSGLVNSKADQADVLARLNDVTGRRVVVDDLRVLPTADPFVFQSVLNSDGQSFTGNVPSELDRMAFAGRIGADAAGEMVLAAGVPDGEWSGVVNRGLDGLTHLKNGELLIQGTAVSLTGLAAVPTSKQQALAALDGLPAGYTLSTDIEVEDDGTPMRLTMSSQDGGATATGKVPAGVDTAQLLSNIGFAVDGADVDIAKIAGPTPDWAGFAATGVAALGRLNSGDLSVSGTDMTVSGVATRSERTAAEAALAVLGTPYAVTTDIKLLDDGKPFSLKAVSDGSSVTSSGKFPFDSDAGLANTVLGQDGTSRVDVAEIADATGAWIGLAEGGLAALGELETGTLSIKDTALTLSGEGTRDGKASAEAMIAALGGTSDIGIYDDGTPFTLNATFDGDVASATGKLPYDMTVADVSGGFGADVSTDIVVAEIESDGGAWPQAADAGLQALSKLQNGSLSLVGQAMTLTGTALTPDNGAEITDLLSNLPTGFTAETSFDYLDDGAVSDITVDFAADRGAGVTGKLPAGLTAPDVGDALNLADIQSTATEGLVGTSDVAIDALTKLSGWLPELDTANLNVREDDVTLTAVAAPGVDFELLENGIQADFPNAKLTAQSGDLPATGTERTNILTGLNERFSGVAWTPVFDFDPQKPSCQAMSVEILANNRVNYVTGKARLDARSVRAVNALAGMINHCLSTGQLWAEVGGHTDSVGSASGNERLSQARADAVLRALLDRGVAADRVTAVGYGAANPIASNDTDEGRAANRRTEITWSDTAPDQTEKTQEE